jgi:hypothetical protein
MNHITRALAIVLAVVASACGQRASSSTNVFGHDAGPIAVGHSRPGRSLERESPDLALRADSLSALDPRAEALAAIQRGDLRYLAACLFECKPIGVPQDSLCPLAGCATSRADVHQISGIAEGAFNADAERLIRVAAEFGLKYNAVIHEYRLRRRPSARRAA